MNEVTITIEERILIAICDAALRNQGIQMMQPTALVLNAIQQAKQGVGNGGGSKRSESYATQ